MKRESCCWFLFLLPKCMEHQGVWERRNDDDVYMDGSGALGHHERLKELGKESWKEKISKNNPINICPRDWRQDPQVVGWQLLNTLQQKVSLYAKWFHYILSEFISHSEWRLVGKQWIHYFSEWGLVNYTHILE